MRRLWLGVMALTAACAVTEPPPATTVRVDPSGDGSWPAARGETDLVVRAVALGPDAAQQEVAGARCAARSALYAAEFAAPARVLVPDFGSASPPIAVECRAGGAIGRAESRPEPYGSRGLGGWPAIGVSVGTGDHSGVGVGFGWYGGPLWSGGQPAMRYPAVRVVLR